MDTLVRGSRKSGIHGCSSDFWSYQEIHEYSDKGSVDDPEMSEGPRNP